MPTRILREGILTSALVNALSESAELFYRRLQSVADDHGRFYSHPTILRTHCYPTKPDTKTDEDVKQMLNECIANDLIIQYGPTKQYLHIVKFGQQTRSRSKFPNPSPDELLIIRKADAKQMFSLDVVEDEVVVEDVYGVRAKLCQWFRRRAETKWSEKEEKVIKTVLQSKPTEDDIALLEAYYTAEIPSDTDYRRRDLVTLLNNWNGEIDRAKRWKSTPSNQVNRRELETQLRAVEAQIKAIEGRGTEEMGRIIPLPKDSESYRQLKQKRRELNDKIAQL